MTQERQSLDDTPDVVLAEPTPYPLSLILPTVDAPPVGPPDQPLPELPARTGLDRAGDIAVLLALIAVLAFAPAAYLTANRLPGCGFRPSSG